MLTQRKVNDICHMIKRNGEEITIAKVRVLMDQQDSFCALADKVLLFKENPELAKKLALREEPLKAIRNSENLTGLIYDALQSFNVPKDVDIALLLQEKIHKFFEDSVNTKIQAIKDQLKQTQLLNDHIEIRYYGLKSRYASLVAKYTELKESHYQLQQNFQNVIAAKDKWIAEDQVVEKAVQVRDYQSQMKLLSGECCAAYDAKRNQIVLKVPVKHALVRELKKGASSIYLCANSTFDYTSKYWLLDSFEAKTIRLLMRNNFVISKELSLMLSHLQQQSN